MNPGPGNAEAEANTEVVRHLKRCLDPDGILAPGRYLPPVLRD